MSRCRLEATGDRPRRAPNPPPVRNAGCGGKEFQGMHAAKSAKSIALQEKTRNSRNSGLVQRVAMGRAHSASISAAERRLFTGLLVGGAWARVGGDPLPGAGAGWKGSRPPLTSSGGAIGHCRLLGPSPATCVMCRAEPALEKRGCIPCILCIPLRRNGSEEKTALHSLVFLEASPCIPPPLSLPRACCVGPVCRLQATERDDLNRYRGPGRLLNDLQGLVVATRKGKEGRCSFLHYSLSDCGADWLARVLDP